MVGVPDATWGERIGAMIVLRSGTLDLPQLREHVAKELPKYKLPTVLKVRIARRFALARLTVAGRCEGCGDNSAQRDGKG